MTGAESPADRGVGVADAFVELVRRLVDDFDVIEMLTVLSVRGVELLGASATGILLADGDGTLRVMAASNERAHLLELMQLQNDEGPCLDCYRTGTVVAHADLASTSPWPKFAAASVDAGYSSVCAIPMRMNRLVMGSMNLFMSEPAALSERDIALAQGLADVASIAIVQNQATQKSAERVRQLQHALDSRIAIEQAKGMIAAQDDVDMDVAFSRLRAHARHNNQQLTDVAKGVIAGSTIIGR